MADATLEIVTSVGPHDEKVLSLKGPLTIHTLFTFQTAVREQGSSPLIIDFSGVPFMDSAGLGALVGACVALQKTHQKLAFSGMNPQVKALLDMTHVSQFFRIFPTLEEAQAAVA
jgi:anti-sigma B factor antagonist